MWVMYFTLKGCLVVLIHYNGASLFGPVGVVRNSYG